MSVCSLCTSAVVIVVACLLAIVGVARGADLIVYDDALENGFDDWSWGTYSLTNSNPVHAGSDSISQLVNNYEGLFFQASSSRSVSLYSSLEFWIKAATPGGQSLSVSVRETNGGSVVKTATVSSILEGYSSIPTNAWAKGVLDLSATPGTFSSVWFQADNSANEGYVYIDDILFVASSGSEVVNGDSFTVEVDLTRNRRVINKEIYGVNFADASMMASGGYTVNRKGGNSETRYSWEYDASNRANDWFFLNIAEETADVDALPSGSANDLFVELTQSANAEPMLTVPMIGWAPKSRDLTWSYSIYKYGSQTNSECQETGWASWCRSDAGNGISSSTNKEITSNDKTDTSKAVTSAYATGLINHLITEFGLAAEGGVKYYSLDNEMTLWDSTHFDVHNTPVSYDDIWSITVDYATAIKTADPNAITFGPVAWGWCAYFWSGVDDCGSTPTDREAHGDVPLLEWYTQQVCDHTSLRLVDYLDIHYYPQNDEYSDDESTEIYTRRLESVKSLYDPTYVDQSWVASVVMLIPRMKTIIQDHCPTMKLSITEYNFGGISNSNLTSGALAQAEVLGIFGREGVDLATRWTAPAVGSLIEDSFQLYLKYDGVNAISGESVYAESTSVDDVGAYAIHNQDTNKLYVVLINKLLTAKTVNISVASGQVSSVSGAYGFDSTHSLQQLTGITTTLPNGDINVRLSTSSATLVILNCIATASTSEHSTSTSTHTSTTTSTSEEPTSTSTRTSNSDSYGGSSSNGNSHAHLSESTSSATKGTVIGTLFVVLNVFVLLV